MFTLPVKVILKPLIYNIYCNLSQLIVNYARKLKAKSRKNKNGKEKNRFSIADYVLRTRVQEI
jgi:hypothetical protein